MTAPLDSRAGPLPRLPPEAATARSVWTQALSSTLNQAALAASILPPSGAASIEKGKVMHRAFIAAAAAAFACAVVVSAPATGGEAEDAAQAKAIVEAYKAARDADIRASRRVWRALGIALDCRECSGTQIRDKVSRGGEMNEFGVVEHAYEILHKEFYKEELRK